MRELRVGDRVRVPFCMPNLPGAKIERLEAILLNLDKGHKWSDGVQSPSWQVRINAPGRLGHRWMVHVDPSCIEVLPMRRRPSRIFRALNRMHIAASQCETIITIARNPDAEGHYNPTALAMARAILRAAIQNRHRTRGWRNEMRTVLTSEKGEQP